MCFSFDFVLFWGGFSHVDNNNPDWDLECEMRAGRGERDEITRLAERRVPPACRRKDVFGAFASLFPNQ